MSGQKGYSTNQLFKSKTLNFESLGIGGLDAQFDSIFRRAFASRVFSPNIIERLGISHVKGMLLFGPPGACQQPAGAPPPPPGRLCCVVLCCVGAALMEIDLHFVIAIHVCLEPFFTFVYQPFNR